MALPSQDYAIAPAGGPSPTPWVGISGFGRKARWVLLGQTGPTDYQLVRSNGAVVASWSASTGATAEKPDTVYIPTDVRIEARRSSGALALAVIVQEGVAWPGRT
jgi:hypothetical protein